MKSVFNCVISNMRNAFCPGNLVTDNRLVSFEVLYNLKRKRQYEEEYMAFEVDKQKAYGCMEWD